MSKWGLEGVKAGDVLVIRNSNYGSSDSLATVDRVTKTLAVCGSVRYRISDGRPTGDAYFGWDRQRAQIATAEDIERVQLRITRDQLVRLLQEQKNTWTLSTIKQVLASLTDDRLTTAEHMVNRP